jgi:hypothetical protein
MSLRSIRRLVLTSTALGLAALFGVTRLAIAEDPPKPDPGMGDPGMADPGADPGMADPAVVPPAGDPAAPPPKKPEPVLKAKAEEELKLLESHLKQKKGDNNSDILASLDSVANAYHNYAPNDEAGQATLEEDKAKYQKEVEKVFLDAYKLKRINPKAKANERDDVNIKAVQLIATFRPDVTDNLIKILTEVIFKVKEDDYKVPQTLIDESFKAVGMLGDKKAGMPWLMTWIKYDNTAGMPERIKAAYDAMVLMKVLEVPGKVRFQIVKDTLKTFPGVEQSAQQNQTKEQRSQKEVWDKIKGSVIKALQYYSQEPKNAKGQLFSTVKEFNEWFRDHDGSDPLWKDPKK